MEFQVIISVRAEKNLDDIAGYLAANWSEELKTDFLVELTEKINRIARMPYMYRASDKKAGVRECVLNKYVIVYYRVLEQKQEIEIITIQDARQNPDTLRL